LLLRTSKAYHQFAGQTPSRTATVKSGAQRCRITRPIADTSSATPER